MALRMDNEAVASLSMALPARPITVYSKRHTDFEWDAVKPIVQKMKGVFELRKGNLSARYKDWKLNKDVTKDEMRVITRKIEKRKGQGKDTIVRVRGRIVDYKVRRWQSNHMKSENIITESEDVLPVTPSTPSAISCFTPSDHSSSPTIPNGNILSKHRERFVTAALPMIEDKKRGGDQFEFSHTLDPVAFLDEDVSRFDGQSPPPLSAPSSPAIILPLYPDSSNQALQASEPDSTFTAKRYREDEERGLRLRLDEFLQTVGEHHPATIDTMFRLSIVLELQGRYMTAEKFLRKTIQLYQVAFGPSHALTLNGLGRLAYLMNKQGRHLAAERIITPLNEFVPTVLPATNPVLTDIKLTSAKTMRYLGRFKDGESISRSLLEPSNYSSLEGQQLIDAEFELSLLLYYQGELHQAEGIVREAVDLSIKREGTLGLQTLSTLGLLAFILFRDDQISEAEQILQDVIAKQANLLGWNHPNTLNSRYVMSAVLGKQGKQTECKMILRSLIPAMERVFEPSHPLSLGCKKGLAEILFVEDEQLEARVLGIGLVEDIKKALGLDHPMTKWIKSLMDRMWE